MSSHSAFGRNPANRVLEILHDQESWFVLFFSQSLFFPQLELEYKFTTLDLVEGKPSTFYATYEAVFEIRMPGQEPMDMPQGGLMRVVREGGKAKEWTMYEDPTPFVMMAMQGAFKDRM